MTYQGQPARVTNNLLKALVILAIAWFAYWAATGGLDQAFDDEVGAPTTTVVSE